VNGKAIMSGVKLEELSAEHMVDVIHYMFEEDSLRITSGEQAEAQSKIRENLYKLLYDADYKYKYTSSSKSGAYSNAGGTTIGRPLDDDIPVPVDPLARQQKAYTPPSKFDPEETRPFGDILDAPLN
jgi:hypothetical protein